MLVCQRDGPNLGVRLVNGSVPDHAHVDPKTAQSPTRDTAPPHPHNAEHCSSPVYQKGSGFAPEKMTSMAYSQSYEKCRHAKPKQNLQRALHAQNPRTKTKQGTRPSRATGLHLARQRRLRAFAHWRPTAWQTKREPLDAYKACVASGTLSHESHVSHWTQ